jgi:hypothetical protein
MRARQMHAYGTHAHEVIAEGPEMKSVIKDKLLKELEDIIKEVGNGGEVDPECTLDSSHNCRGHFAHFTLVEPKRPIARRIRWYGDIRKIDDGLSPGAISNLNTKLQREMQITRGQVSSYCLPLSTNFNAPLL